jgi:hypothetical protein
MAGENLGRRPGVAIFVAAFAALSLLLGLLVTPAASHAEGAASIAKKKCSKGKKASAAKKKKCKKAHPAPLARGTITWSQPVDVDLHAYDAGGNHSGWVGPPPGAIVQGIPSSSMSADASAGGTETFTDNVFVRHGLTNRDFSYILCFYGTASGTFTGVTRQGVASSLPFSGVLGQAVTFTLPGGPALPSTSPC